MEKTYRIYSGDERKMAQSVPVQPMPEFNPDAEVGASVATRWITWLSDFEMFLLASGITNTKRQRALFLYTAGPRVREIFKQIPSNEDENNFKMAKEKLTEYFQPQTNRRYKVYRFRQTKQNQEESLDQFHTRLRTLAQNCEFAEDNLEFEIEQQILVGGTSSRIRKRALTLFWTGSGRTLYWTEGQKSPRVNSAI